MAVTENWSPHSTCFDPSQLEGGEICDDFSALWFGHSWNQIQNINNLFSLLICWESFCRAFINKTWEASHGHLNFWWVSIPVPIFLLASNKSTIIARSWWGRGCYLSPSNFFIFQRKAISWLKTSYGAERISSLLWKEICKHICFLIVWCSGLYWPLLHITSEERRGHLIQLYQSVYWPSDWGLQAIYDFLWY